MSCFGRRSAPSSSADEREEGKRLMPTLTRNNWTVNYDWSPSSGLRLGYCQYKGTGVLYSASVPFVYVNYTGPFGPFTDELQSLSTAIDVRDIMMGFDLKVKYDLYGPDYQYDHVWRFHDDGQFGSSIIIQGPGEEIDGQHTYHIPFRFDLDLSGSGGDSVQRWVSLGGIGGYWQDVSVEGQLTPGALPTLYYDWQVIDKALNKRAMIRAGDHDNGELWALHYSGAESWASWGGTQPAPPGSPG